MNTPLSSTDRVTALEHLASDVFAHLMTLKMLTLYPSACITTTFREGNNWSCLTVLDIAASPWDRQKYPNHKIVVFLDGNAEELLRIAFENAPKKSAVFKIHDAFSKSLVTQLLGTEQTYAFLSYSTSTSTKVPSDSAVQAYDKLTPEAIHGFEQNAYTFDELQSHFQNGARWFGLRINDSCASQCLVFQNFHPIWEIGGVFTPPELRRKGYAKKVVQAAIRYLKLHNRIPRYQFEDSNYGSRALADSLGLHHILTVEHFTT